LIDIIEYQKKILCKIKVMRMFFTYNLEIIKIQGEILLKKYYS